MRLTESVGSRTLVSTGDDVEALCLVKECRELETAFWTKFAEDLLKDGGGGVSKQRLKIIFKIGRESLLASCAETGKVPLAVSQEIATICEGPLSPQPRNTTPLHAHIVYTSNKKRNKM